MTFIFSNLYVQSSSWHSAATPLLIQWFSGLSDGSWIFKT